MYPVTIIQDRYTGVYSGAKWIAFNLDPEDIPKDVAGNDIECANFWENTKEMIGKGETPTDAYEDLELQLLKKRAKI